MSEKRFYVKKVTRDERPKLFSSVGADYKYFIVKRVKRSWGEYGGNFLFNFGVDYAFAEKVCNLLNEQQDKITELEKNFDDLVNWASEISKRNVVLDEQIGELQRENEQLKETNERLQ